MCKVNLFDAKKEMAERVLEYMTCRVWIISVRTIHKIKIQNLESLIDSQEKLRGSILGVDTDEEIARYKDAIAAEDARYEKVLSDNKDKNFKYLPADNTLYAKYHKATTDAQIFEAIRAWFLVYGLDVSDADFIHDFMDAISGRAKAKAERTILSGATEFTSKKRSKGDVLGIFYGLLAEKMVAAGTLKPCQICEEVRDHYVKIASERISRAEKKAAKKAKRAAKTENK